MSFYHRRCIFVLTWLLSHAVVVNAAEYVGAQQCAGCHQQQYAQWQQSHHDLAMQTVSADTVLGDFNDASFSYNGITTRFYRKAGEFWVKTDGFDGKLQDFKIAYVFGVTPLQQYLIAFDDGRYQALNIAWDSRPASEGGQRWFHLYPDEKVNHEDVLHWTRFSHNWNNRCADCHSTDLQKHYDAEHNQYRTRWSEINVACEACHGPGADHVQWAKADPASTAKSVNGYGLVMDVSAPGHWQRGQGQATAHLLTDKARGDRQINTCAVCHSRRSPISDAQTQAGRDSLLSQQLYNGHAVSLLEPGLYHSDGQILDEVYVYGSFVQSKMYRSGVVCSDCHNPHSLRLRAEGNTLCAGCHNPEQFDRPEHHHHPVDSTGAQCVNCHMPETTYMVVDPRRDHSLRIPRPDLSDKLNTPNACIQCHDTQTNAWALQHFRQWYPNRVGSSHYGEVLHAGFSAQPAAMPQLATLANDVAASDLVRASALRLMGQYSNPYAFNTAMTLLESSSALVRRAALLVLADIQPQQAVQTVLPLLQDPAKAVRLEAVRLLLLAGVGMNGALLPESQRQLFNRVLAEYAASLAVNADSPGGQIQLGVYHQLQGQQAAAITAYNRALAIEPDFIPAMINLADIYRMQGNEAEAKRYLQRALQVDSNNVSANFSLGLLLIRTGQLPQALTHLERAASQAPDIAHYRYVFAVGLYEAGQPERAISELKATLKAHPDNQQVRSALVGYLRAIGKPQEAQQYLVP